MYPEAYKEWINLFNDDFLEMWQHERKELQKVALLFCALQKELKNVQTNVEIEVSNLKQQLKYKDELKRKTKHHLSSDGRKRSPNSLNKENKFVKQIEKQAGDASVKDNQIEKESPDLFKNIDVNAPFSSTDISCIDLSISDDDSTKISGSPTIKKRRKRYRISSNPPAFNIISETDEKPSTPVTTVSESVRSNLFKTPGFKSYHDLSVIDGTPEVVPKKSKTISKTGSSLINKRSKIKKNNNTTLTQMFKSTRSTTNEKTENDADSDETFFEENASQTKMGITEMLNYINKDDSSKCEDDGYTNNRKNQDQSICQDLETSTDEVDQFSKGCIFNDEDVETETPTENPKVIITDPEPVVRGKARKQLHGWSCQQCKNFYGNMKIPPEEIQKKMDECSKHRYKYRPPEETIPGFWDLSIPPEKLE